MCIWLFVPPTTAGSIEHSQSVVLMPFINGVPPCPAPLMKQVLNMAKSNAGLVPTNMLLPSGASDVTCPQVNCRPRRKGGYRYNGE